jgi:cell division protein FtsZ
MVEQREHRPDSDESSWERAPARIKVVGVGGGGCNCVRRMLSHRVVPGVRFIAVNTDIKALENIREGAEVLPIGERTTRGWGAGGDAKVGAKAAEESSASIRKALKDAEMVFVTAGMGGGTGTGAAPIIASLAKEMGALVVGVVTTPFNFEGKRRLEKAIAGVGQLRPYLDNLIVIHNDRLLQYVNHDAGMLDAFRTADEVVTQGIMSISEVINVPGEINVDFADVKSVMAHPGSALMAIGVGHGQKGPLDAAKQAIANPLLDISIKGAQGVLFVVKGGQELTLGGVNAAGELIANTVRKDAEIFFGMSIDRSIGDEVRMTMIATGLKQEGVAGAWTGGSKAKAPAQGEKRS